MHYYEVAPNQIIRTDSDYFTYSSVEKMQLGQIVVVEVGKKKVVGVIIKETTVPKYSTKPIYSVIDGTPLPHQLINLALWISSYYITPLATTLQTILPSGVQKNRRQNSEHTEIVQRERTNNLFNDEQSNSLKILSESKPGTFLLHGT